MSKERNAKDNKAVATGKQVRESDRRSVALDSLLSTHCCRLVLATSYCLISSSATVICTSVPIASGM